jgi:peptide/nickel transport system permease protein
MATKKPERFNEVDWSEIDENDSKLFSLSTNAILLLLTTMPLTALFLYDFFTVSSRDATFEELGADLGIAGVFESVGVTWDLTPLDFLFIFTLSVFLFYFILPLYQNPRQTKHYWREFKQNRPALVSLVWLGIVFVGGLIGPLFMSKPEPDLAAAYQPPIFLDIPNSYPITCAGDVVDGACQGTGEYLLGTTEQGAGVFATIVYGMTITLKIAFIASLLVAIIGVSVGTLSAYSGGLVDEWLMRFTDIVLSFPTFIFFLLIVYAYGSSIALLIFIFGVFSWGGFARYVRSKSLSVSEEEYIQAVQISGASTFRIVRRHVVPNTASSIITQLTLAIPGFLLAEAQLAFLDLGAEGAPSWGGLLESGFNSLGFAPWITLAPGVVLFLTILAINFVGDALLDALNPRATSESEGGPGTGGM